MKPLAVLDIRGPEHPHYPALILVLIALFTLSLIYYTRARKETFLSCIRPAPFAGPFVTGLPMFKSGKNTVEIKVFHNTKVCNSRACQDRANAIAATLNRDPRMAPPKASKQYTVSPASLDAVLSKNGANAYLSNPACFPYVQYIIRVNEPAHQKAEIKKYTLALDNEGILRDIKAGVDAVKNLWSL
jgi:hypothetical protein